MYSSTRQKTHHGVVLWGRHRHSEHGGRDVHAVCSHCSVGVSSNVAKRVVGLVVVIKRDYRKLNSELVYH